MATLNKNSESHKFAERENKDKLNRSAENLSLGSNSHSHLAGESASEEALSLSNRRTSQEFNIASNIDSTSDSYDSTYYYDSFEEKGNQIRDRLESAKQYEHAAIDTNGKLSLNEQHTLSQHYQETMHIANDRIDDLSNYIAEKNNEDSALYASHHKGNKSDNHVNNQSRKNGSKNRRLSHAQKSEGRLSYRSQKHREYEQVIRDNSVSKLNANLSVVHHQLRRGLRDNLFGETEDYFENEKRIFGAVRYVKKRFPSKKRTKLKTGKSHYQLRSNRKNGYIKPIFDEDTLNLYHKNGSIKTVDEYLAYQKQVEKNKQWRKKQQQRARQAAAFRNSNSVWEYLHYNSAIKKKEAQKEKQKSDDKEKKGMLSSLGAILALLIVAFLILFILFMLIYFIISPMLAFTSPNHISVQSGTTEYAQEVVAKYVYYLTDEEGKEETKEQIMEYLFPDLSMDEIDEWIFDVPDDYSFNEMILISLFSAKYHEYKTEDVMTEIDEIFDELFEDHVWLEEIPYQEYNASLGIWEDKIRRVMHVDVVKGNFDEIVQSKVPEADLTQYKMYIESSNGQHAYGRIFEDNNLTITSTFGYRESPTQGASSNHRGVDIAVPVGTAIYSPVDGVVTCGSDSGSGNFVKITTNDGWTVRLYHLSNNSIVSSGTFVKQGQLVALSGNTGVSTGPHLHLGLNDPSGTYYNPLIYISYDSLNYR